MSLEEDEIREIVRDELEDALSERAASRPRVINETLTTANEEYPIELPARTKKFTMHLRASDIPFKLAFERGSVDGATPKREYFTVKANGDYWEDNLNLEEIFKMYVACATAAQIIEVVAWR